MATILTQFDFQTRSGRTSKYPWDTWTDGSIWEVTRGDDYKSQSQTFRSILHSQATKIGKKVRANVSDDRVVFQFYTPEEPAKTKLRVRMSTTDAGSAVVKKG